ncbi:MAG: NYN domain-containing protein [Aquificae bacterium]|nr:NYN domain-containing protein [Aquificota bacterium]
MSERLMIFIDGSNLFHGLRALNIKIDYSKLVAFLTGDRRLVRAYFYTAVPQDRDVKRGSSEWESLQRQKRFLDELSLMGIKVKTANLRKLPSGEFLEKEVDIMLATDMLALAFRDAYDTAVLVSGDSDFIHTVEEVQRIGKRVENATFKKTSSFNLRKTCDSFLLLDDHLPRFVMEDWKPEKKKEEEKKEQKEGFWEALKKFFSS